MTFVPPTVQPQAAPAQTSEQGAPPTVQPLAAPAQTSEQAKLDLVFTFDCTGSMGAYIAAAKAGITRISERLAQAEGYDVRFGLVAYRDHPPQDQTFVTKVFPFSSSLAEINNSLSELSARGGGDGPEAVAAALHDTLRSDWREDATKVCVLIADAPPHGLGENGDGFPDGGPDGIDPLLVLDQMSAMGITIYSVGCQPALSNYRFATEFFIACAQRTNGQAVALGSAATLADIILGASVEEMDLEALTNQVQTLATEMRAKEPTLEDEAVEQRVFSELKFRGTQTRKVGGARLSSAYSELVSGASSLAVAKASLRDKGPPADEPAYRGLPARSRRACGLGAPPPPGPPPPPGAPPPPPAFIGAPLPAGAPPAFMSKRGAAMVMDGAEEVETASSEISMAQVSRLYGRGKKKGLW